MFLRLKVQILPLAPGENWQKVKNRANYVGN